MTPAQIVGLVLLGLTCLTMFGPGQAGLAQFEELSDPARLVQLLRPQLEDPPRLLPPDSQAVFRRFRDRSLTSPAALTELCVVEAREASLHVVDVRRAGRANETYQRTVPRDALAALNGGFFDRGGPGRLVPVGLVRAGGSTSGKLKRWSTGGVVFQGRGGVQLTPSGEYDPSASDNAIESRPMLINNGMNRWNRQRTGWANRAAVGISYEGTVVLAVVHQPGGGAATLVEFARLLENYRTADGGKLERALGVDGGPAAHLYVPTLDLHCGDEQLSYVHNLMYLRRHE